MSFGIKSSQYIWDDNEYDKHAEEDKKSKLFKFSVEDAMCAYVSLTRTELDRDDRFRAFNELMHADDVGAVIPSLEDNVLAGTILTYWAEKLFLVKLSDTATMTSWRKKVAALCADRYAPMQTKYHSVLITLEQMSEYEMRSDVIATTYNSHGYYPMDGVTMKESFSSLDLRLVESYRHDSAGNKGYVYRLADSENRIYEYVVSGQDSHNTIAAYNALFTLTERIRLVDGWMQMKRINNATHTDFFINRLYVIKTIIPLAGLVEV